MNIRRKNYKYLRQAVEIKRYYDSLECAPMDKCVLDEMESLRSQLSDAELAIRSILKRKKPALWIIGTEN
jgi:hypothetical protein